MLEFIKDIFGNANALTEAGKLCKAQEFVRLFLTSEFRLILLAESSDTANPVPKLTDRELFDLAEELFDSHVGNTTQQVSEVNNYKPNLFTFKEGPTTVLPVFTSGKAVQRYRKQHVSQVEINTLFHLCYKGETLLNFLSEDVKIVLNLKNPSEYWLTEKDMESLMRTRA